MDEPLERTPKLAVATTPVAAERGEDGKAKKMRTGVFVYVLHEMLTKSDFRDICSFNSSGDAVVIKDRRRFASDIMSRYFVHCNWQSFVRQLHLYGFAKAERDELRGCIQRYLYDLGVLSLHVREAQARISSSVALCARLVDVVEHLGGPALLAGFPSFVFDRRFCDASVPLSLIEAEHESGPAAAAWSAPALHQDTRHHEMAGVSMFTASSAATASSAPECFTYSEDPLGEVDVTAASPEPRVLHSEQSVDSLHSSGGSYPSSLATSTFESFGEASFHSASIAPSAEGVDTTYVYVQHPSSAPASTTFSIVDLPSTPGASDYFGSGATAVTASRYGGLFSGECSTNSLGLFNASAHAARSRSQSVHERGRSDLTAHLSHSSLASAI
ncbi:heat shock factor family protein [Rhodotorula paludigena]|uniref:heat shock factor family protein n=1 Tax=Rhodotorula paludigena TaxID=86838 RepID=UPI003174AD69